MIDIGGRRCCAPRRRTSRTWRASRPDRYGFVLDSCTRRRACRWRRGATLASEAFAHDGGVRGARSRPGSPSGEALPERLDPEFEECRPRLRREPPPARGVTTPRPARAAICSRGSSSCTAGALVQQPATTSRRARLAEGVHAAGLRDRQAREPVRCAGRRDDRGRVRQALGVGPGSAYGGVVVLNRPVWTRISAERIAEQFVECCSRPATRPARWRR